MDISTHSAREDGDDNCNTIKVFRKQFQPTPPARTETGICRAGGGRI